MKPHPTEAPEPYAVADRDVSHAVIEIFAGDNNLSQFVLEDMKEILAGMSRPFSVLAMADFVDTEAAVIELSPDGGGRVLDHLGEIDTGDPQTLADFLSRALVSYSPSTRKAIGFWDHGSGVFDEYDPNEVSLERRLRSYPRYRRSRSVSARRLFISRGRLFSDVRTRAMLHDDTNGGVLTNHEAYGVLQQAFDRSGSDPVDIIFSDTCLNGMIEVLAQFNEFAETVVGSEDLEPGDGWDYYEWFHTMSQAPPRTAEEWSKQAVEAFERGYKRRPAAHPCTLGAFRSDQRISSVFKDLILACDDHGKTGFDWLREARDYSQSFARHDTYDIRDFVGNLHIVATDARVQELCEELTRAFDEARIHSTALGEEVKNAQGLAFWFPSNRYAYRQVVDTYRKLRFDKDTDWSDYLENQFFGREARERLLKSASRSKK